MNASRRRPVGITSKNCSTASATSGRRSGCSGDRPRKADVGIAKNYPNQDELRALNLIVAAYLDFAELQAVSRRPMRMVDWIVKLDNFIRISDRQILAHAGTVSHEIAKLKAESELERFRAPRRSKN